jgi:hypothetical protein
MASPPDALGPMLEPGTITTLVGPVGAELAALTAALAVSYKSGRALIPGFVPAGPSEVSVYCYKGTWIDWMSLEFNICVAAGIRPVPVMHLECLSEPLVQHRAVERDPDASAYWLPHLEADVDRDVAAASAAGRELPPVLTIVFDATNAAGVHAVEMEAAALYAYATAKQRDIVCVAHVTNNMGIGGDDFEKGSDAGAHRTLAVVDAIVRAWMLRRPRLDHQTSAKRPPAAIEQFE